MIPGGFIMAVTIKDVAALAGVSSSTVSRTCKNNPSISEETKEKVRRAMAQLGYEPNFQASNLASQNSRTIGIILPVSAREAYENSFYLEAIRGISQLCNKRQYINTVITGESEEEVLQVIKTMARSGQVDGFIVLYSRHNVIGFPYIFRGALDTRATAINEEMKLAAVRAIAGLAKKAVPDVVNEAYHVNNLSFGPEYFIPKPVDPRLITEVSMAVAKAAMDSGVARKQITDWEGYKNHLRELMGQENKLTRQLYETARRCPQRVVFAEGTHPNMLKAAVEAKSEGICNPIILGNEERIEKLAKELDLNLEGIEIVNLRHDREAERRERYARILCEKRAREGANFQEANDKMFERNYFGMMMVETGEADAFVTGLYTKYSNTIKVAKEVIGIQPEYKHFGTMHILNSKKGTFFIADTLINRHPDTDTLIDIAKLSAKAVRFFNQEPVMAMLSYSNFGSDQEGSPAKVHEAINYMHQNYPELAIDGEMQVKFALDNTLRDEKYPFTRLKGKEVNTLVFPNLSSANATYQLIQNMSETEVIGPIQMGLNKPIHFTDIESSVRDIVNITAIACIDAIVAKKMKCNQ